MLAHFFKRPANARITRQPLATIGRPFKGGNGDGHRKAPPGENHRLRGWQVVKANSPGLKTIPFRVQFVRIAACCVEEEEAKEPPFPTIDQATRTELGRPRSSIRLRTWAAEVTSVARTSSLWKRNLSPMTCLQRANRPQRGLFRY